EATEAQRQLHQRQRSVDGRRPESGHGLCAFGVELLQAEEVVLSTEYTVPSTEEWEGHHAVASGQGTKNHRGTRYSLLATQYSVPRRPLPILSSSSSTSAPWTFACPPMPAGRSSSMFSTN